MTHSLHYGKTIELKADQITLDGDLTLDGDVNVTGDLTVGGDLGVTGGALIGGSVGIVGALDVQGLSVFHDNAQFIGDINVIMNSQFQGQVTANGGVNIIAGGLNNDSDTTFGGSLRFTTFANAPIYRYTEDTYLMSLSSFPASAFKVHVCRFNDFCWISCYCTNGFTQGGADTPPLLMDTSLGSEFRPNDDYHFSHTVISNAGAQIPGTAIITNSSGAVSLYIDTNGATPVFPANVVYAAGTSWNGVYSLL